MNNFKYFALSFFLLAFLGKTYTQNINFSLANPQPIIQEVYSGSILSGDFDDDGDMDLVQSGLGLNLVGASARVSVFLNDGNGDFTLKDQNFSNFSLTEEVAMADFDNDGDLDLIITAENHSELYLNDGQANFILSNNSALEPTSSSDIITADIDGDNDIDVIQFGAPNSTQFPPFANLYLNNGAGVLTQSQDIAFTPFRQPAIEFIDLEGDGDLDVLSFGKNESDETEVAVYENDGAGSYSVFSNSNIAPHLSDEISVGDIDDDGDEDILITGMTTDGTVKTILYLNDGTGQFSELMDTPFPDIFAGSNAFADFDNDNDLDILLIGSMNGGLPNIFSIVFENLGNNNFVASDSLGGEYIAKRTIADFNGDGKKDIIIQGFVDDTNIYWNESILSTTEKILNNAFSVFPNPTTGQLQIRCDQDIFNTIEILDQQGKLIYTKSVAEQILYNIEIDAPVGVYILKMSGEKGTSTQKIILIK